MTGDRRNGSVALSRRSVLGGLSGALAGAAIVRPAAAQEQATQTTGDTGFSFDALAARMREKARHDYEPQTVDVPEAIRNLDYEAYKQVAFRPDRAVWGDSDLPFRIQAFHMGWLFNDPVKLFVVENGEASELTFSAADFEYRPPLDPAAFEGLQMPGVAGFRLHFPLNRPDVFDEVIAFQGASYFRAVGHRNAYGISARGLAVNTATGSEEEFPRFTEFYIEKPGPGARSIMVYAAMESPSLTGAYAFRITPGTDTVTDVRAHLFFRADIQRLGVAPMTSMFLFGENNQAAFDDYRERVHDSEGLRIVRRSGEELWRHLNNPHVLANSFFGEDQPVSFALNQRHRMFEDYQDAEAHYERRPSLRVEPGQGWGKGHIQLVEIPANADHMDNVVAFWTPADRATAGSELALDYRLVWGSPGSETSTLARAIATRTGVGGTAGARNEDGLRKFVIDYEGGMLPGLPPDAALSPKIYVGGGELKASALHRINDGIWRFAFDVLPAVDGPVELSVSLDMAGRPVTETWLYQWRPGDERRRA